MRYPIERVAAIHDLSGYGRCALTVVIPILSSMKIQVCPVPTAVLSTHTGGFKDYTFIDLTDTLQDYLNHWKSINLNFDCIYSGFLGSYKQIDIVSKFIDDFKNNNTIVLVDPVMGDDGKLYDTIDEKMVMKMADLVKKADIITPNITEALYLLNEKHSNNLDDKKIKEYLVRLSNMGPKTVIITSCPETDKKTSVIAYNSLDKRFWKVKCDYIPTQYPGTGDIFASVLVGSLIKGDSLPIALDRAVQFVSIAIKTTFGYNMNPRDGVFIEKVLNSLDAPVTNAGYELI